MDKGSNNVFGLDIGRTLVESSSLGGMHQQLKSQWTNEGYSLKQIITATLLSFVAGRCDNGQQDEADTVSTIV